MSGRHGRSRLTELQEIGWTWWVRVAVPIVLLLGAGVIAGFRVNVSRSLPLGLYRTVGDASMVVRGSTVIVCLPPEWSRYAVQRRILGPGQCAGGSYGLGKMVLAVAGDVVELRPEGITVNGSSIPNSRPILRDREDREVAHHPWGTYILGHSEVWLFSQYHRAAFDSRYFGPISASQIRSVIRPVWTDHRHQ